MNAKRILQTVVFGLILFCSACAPGAPTPIAVEPRPQDPVYEEPPVEAPRPAATRIVEVPGEALPADNYFQDYGVNPETETWDDHLSTFGLDVDTASYSVARQYINDGYLPPYDSVRLEEFVNTFDQGYDLPEDAAFSIYADGAPAPRGFEPDSYILRVGVQGYRMEEWERKPAVLTFVIDVSGSMGQDNRLGLVKRSLHGLVDRLDSWDTVAIVVYGTNARALLRPIAGDHRDVILRAIDSLQPEGTTNAEAGLQLGYRYALQLYEPGSINRVILCSDGVANVGNTDADSILRSVEEYVDQGITLTTVGFGMGNFNDVLLEQLADKGDGNYAYVDTPEEAERIFVDDLTSTLQVIAKDAKVQVDFNPEIVESYRLMGYENRGVADQDFRDDSVDAGELGAGHTATALYVVMLAHRAEGRMATVQLRWEDPDTGEVKEINGNFNTWDLAVDFDDTDPYYQLAVTVAQFAEMLRESPYIDEVSVRELERRADRLEELLDGDEQVKDFVWLLKQAAWLRR